MKQTHTAQSSSSRSTRLPKMARIALLICGLIVGAWAVSVFATAIIVPLVDKYQSTERVTELVQQVAAKQRERKHLEARIKRLKSPLGIEEEARRRGQVKPGEERVQFVLQHQARAAAPQAASTAPAANEGILWPALLFFALTFCIAGLLLYRRQRLALARRPAGVLTPRSELNKRRRQVPLPEHPITPAQSDPYRPRLRPH